MKINKFLYIVILFSMLNLTVYGSTSDLLNKIESDFYGFSYTNDKTKNRVERLEKSVYGKVGNGDINKRITKLSADISADVIGQEITPVRDSFMEEDSITEDTNVSYPIVEEIEKQLFNTTYKNRDFHTRIVTIEKKLFGKIYDVDDYSKRMERIKAKMYPDNIANYNQPQNDYTEYYNDNVITSDSLSGINNDRYRMPYGQRNYTRPYSNYGDFTGVGSDVLSQRDLNDDLTQLEYDMFGTEFSSDDTQTRIKRLNSASKAKKSTHKYDSNKFSQHMSTAMEIGAMILMILAMVL